MKLVVGIDGESYSELRHAFVETDKEAFEWIKEDVKEFDCFDIVKDGDKIYSRFYRSDFDVVFLGMVDIPSFRVYQLFDIDETKPFVVVHWHSYDGVDFDIDQFYTYKEARKYMNDAVTCVVANNKNYSIEWFDNKGACVDVKSEWMMWSIIERS